MSAGADGEPRAAAAVAVASLDPPLVAIFPGAGGRMVEQIARSGRFTVSLLPEEDEGAG